MCILQHEDSTKTTDVLPNPSVKIVPHENYHASARMLSYVQPIILTCLDQVQVALWVTIMTFSLQFRYDINIISKQNLPTRNLNVLR